MAGRRATSGLGSNLYAEFLAQHSRLTDSLEPSTHSRHAFEINTITPNGTALGLQTCVVASLLVKPLSNAVSSLRSSVKVTSTR
ncbi:unnamed protein product [Peronospora destructor]|uniref:Uncharacterized protein n=1 Tax=Peronospora destructor TaxID=86335 RepID=A0AAV0UMI4_9STRA|nr:unnamed protein product [Peronospora destructor]